jgi:hypothetical protein
LKLPCHKPKSQKNCPEKLLQTCKLSYVGSSDWAVIVTQYSTS